MFVGNNTASIGSLCRSKHKKQRGKHASIHGCRQLSTRLRQSIFLNYLIQYSIMSSF